MQDKEYDLEGGVPYEAIRMDEVVSICRNTGLYAVFDGDSKRVFFRRAVEL
jgi:hypothetical protein